MEVKNEGLKNLLKELGFTVKKMVCVEVDDKEKIKYIRGYTEKGQPVYVKVDEEFQDSQGRAKGRMYGASTTPSNIPFSLKRGTIEHLGNRSAGVVFECDDQVCTIVRSESFDPVEETFDPVPAKGSKAASRSSKNATKNSLPASRTTRRPLSSAGESLSELSNDAKNQGGSESVVEGGTAKDPVEEITMFRQLLPTKKKSFAAYPVVRIADLKYKTQLVYKDIDESNRKLQNAAYVQSQQGIRDFIQVLNGIIHHTNDFQALQKELFDSLKHSTDALETRQLEFSALDLNDPEVKRAYDLTIYNINRRYELFNELVSSCNQITQFLPEFQILLDKIASTTSSIRENFGNLEYLQEPE